MLFTDVDWRVIPPLVLSSASRKGVPEALRALQAEIDASAKADREPEAAWQP